MLMLWLNDKMKLTFYVISETLMKMEFCYLQKQFQTWCLP